MFVEPRMRLNLSYILPLATGADEDISELAAYLRRLADVVDDVIVVDGSAPHTVRRHRDLIPPPVRVLEPRERTTMGKVGNVVTGAEVARHERVVIADDDVRYEPGQLRRIAERLDAATVVRPQNHFDPLPWHARLDTARVLLARISGGDWPGTLAVRRSAMEAIGGYDGDVLFENLELVRTIVAAGGTEHLALDINVRRLPPTTHHFRGQQIRQAYDEFARPARLVLWLAVLPLGVHSLVRRRWAAIVTAGALTTVAAEAGRRRAGGRQWFPASSSALAAPWVVWRSLCSWAAVGARLRGGVRYRDIRLPRAATPRRVLRRRLAHTTIDRTTAGPGGSIDQSSEVVSTVS